MSIVVLCVDHAAHEALVRAPVVDDGRSRCPRHAGAGASALPDDLLPCAWCRATSHRAWFVVDDEALCIRHAAEAVFGEDDMGAHDMAHAVYLALHAAGVTDTS